MGTIKIKRIYEPFNEEDGYRILVDRLWPRGVRKEKANINEWCKKITPSTEIRKKFHHDPDLMDVFKLEYTIELNNNKYKEEFIENINKKLQDGNVTLLYAAKDEKINHASILKAWIETQLTVI
jgi:uncharacterized protein YeaO (DUF488 family)